MTVNILLCAFVLLMIVTVISSLKKTDYEWKLLDRDNTYTVRGMAILMIVLSHILQYTGDSVTTIGGGWTKRIVGCFGGIGVSVFFFLSGYGNYLSMIKIAKKEVILKTVNRIFRLIIAFIVSFIIVSIISVAINKICGFPDMRFIDVMTSFFLLQMVGTTTWYLKIQIVLYIITAVVFITLPSHMRNAGIFILTVTYVGFAKYMGFADYWWKTCMAYFAGALFAEFYVPINQFVTNHKRITISTSLFAVCAAYLWILKDWRFTLIPQLVSYMVISSGLVLLGCTLKLNFRYLIMLGNASLAIYLTHIGIAYAIFREIIHVEIQIIAFVVLTIITSLVVYEVDKQFVTINKKNRRN